MNARLKSLAVTRLLAPALVAIAASPVQAQTAADAWHWDASVYFWLPAIGGQSSFPADGSSVDVSTQQVIDSLKLALMGSLGAKKGAWGAWTDLVFADFGATKQASRDFTIGHLPLPGGVIDAKLDLDLKATAWTLAGSYALSASPVHQVDLLGGARLLDIQQTLGWTVNGSIAGTPLQGSSGTSRVSLANWDAVVGLKGRSYLNGARTWFVPYYVDVGAGESTHTWQALVGVGYRFDWGSVVASYRHLDYEMKSGQAIQSVNFAGGLVGVAFEW